MGKVNNFRYDINGLRAIAVIAVVIFHFNHDWLPGGFAGVDVFFVISGFLMTKIIFKGIENKTFNLFKFYVARANRIIPALAVLCLALLIFGWFNLTPDDYRFLSKHVISSLGFFSNVIYWQESGYFDSIAYEKWLLHTWSLSVEWQFYIIYPVLLMLLNKFISFENLKRLIVLSTIVGFALSVYVTLYWPDSSYFLLPTRAWEMMLGGIASLYTFNLKEPNKKKIELLGIFLILCSYIFISSDTPWPGYMAILPVFGAFLVLAANRQDSLLTNNVVFQVIGRYSYSIYLWHWPIVVYGYYTFDHWWVIGLPLSFVCGAISYKYVESIRFPSFSSWFNIYRLKPLWGLCLVSVLSVLVYMTVGFNVPYRAIANTPESKILAQYKNYEMDPTRLFNKCNTQEQIQLTGKAKVFDECISKNTKGIFLWGDSHMGALSTGLRKNIDSTIPFSQLTSSACDPSFLIKRNGTDSLDVGCDTSNELAYKMIVKYKPKLVIIGQDKFHEHNDWLATISELKKMGVENVMTIGPFPQWQPSLPSVYVKRHLGQEFIQDNNFEPTIIKSNNYLKSIENEDFIFVDMLSNLCTPVNATKLSCRVAVGNDLFTFDYGHLTVIGADFIVKHYLLDELNKIFE